jgi:hypothetical protein
MDRIKMEQHMSKTLKKVKEKSVLHCKNATKTKKTFGQLLDNQAKYQKANFGKAELRGFVPGHHMDDWL